MTDPVVRDGIIVGYTPRTFGGDPQGYPTTIPCDPPPIQGDECTAGYKEVCKNGYIYCEWDDEKG